MSYIRVITAHIENGMDIVFNAPCDCSKVDGLKIQYNTSDGVTTSRIFKFRDAHRKDVSSLQELFVSGARVRVNLDTMYGYAYIQNADTNSYLEGRFDYIGIEDPTNLGCFYRMVGGNVEWINPPMVSGVEYRTTERFGGSPVYTIMYNHMFSNSDPTPYTVTLPEKATNVRVEAWDKSVRFLTDFREPNSPLSVELGYSGNTPTVTLTIEPTTEFGNTIAFLLIRYNIEK